MKVSFSAFQLTQQHQLALLPQVRVRGHPDDTGSHNKRKTEHVRNNGFNPVWKDATFEFLVKVPELAFLEFKVQ